MEVTCIPDGFTMFLLISYSVIGTPYWVVSACASLGGLDWLRFVVILLPAPWITIFEAHEKAAFNMPPCMAVIENPLDLFAAVFALHASSFISCSGGEMAASTASSAASVRVIHPNSGSCNSE